MALMRLRSTSALRSAMRDAGADDRPLSIRELAKRAGCSKAMIGHLVSGKHERTNHVLAAGIERGLGLDAGTLFDPVVKA